MLSAYAAALSFEVHPGSCIVGIGKIVLAGLLFSRWVSKDYWSPEVSGIERHRGFSEHGTVLASCTALPLSTTTCRLFATSSLSLRSSKINLYPESMFPTGMAKLRN